MSRPMGAPRNLTRKEIDAREAELVAIREEMQKAGAPPPDGNLLVGIYPGRVGLRDTTNLILNCAHGTSELTIWADQNTGEAVGRLIAQKRMDHLTGKPPLICECIPREWRVPAN